MSAGKRADLLAAMEKNVKRICNTDEALLYVVGPNSLQKAENGALSAPLPLTGILAQAISKNQIYDVPHAARSIHFNPIIDINTNCNVRCIPINSTDTNTVLLAIEHVNKKGHMHLDKEIMPYLVKLLCTAASSFERDGRKLVDDPESLK